MIPWKIAYFDQQKLLPFQSTQDKHVYVIPNDCHREPGVFHKWRCFRAPLFDCPPQTPGLDPPLHKRLASSVISASCGHSCLFHSWKAQFHLSRLQISPGLILCSDTERHYCTFINIYTVPITGIDGIIYNRNRWNNSGPDDFGVGLLAVGFIRGDYCIDRW